MTPKSLTLVTMIGFSSLTACASNWTNWNNDQSLGSFYAIAGTAKETVAVGIDGRIATRDNATGVWRIQTFTGDPDFRAIVYGDNQYVVVRETGLIMTSPDGLTWTPRKSPTKEDLLGLFCDGHQYLAGGNEGTILSSPGRHRMDEPQFRKPDQFLQFQLFWDTLCCGGE